MDIQDAGKLLTLIAAAEGREVNAAMAQGWAMYLDDIPFEVAEKAFHDAIHAGEIIRAPQIIRRYAGVHLRRLAANVRSAKLRRYIPQDWPENRPLPPIALDRLRSEFDATNDLPEIEGGTKNRGELDV